MQHFVENSGVGHHIIHVGVVVAGQEFLCDALENKKKIPGKKILWIEGKQLSYSYLGNSPRKGYSAKTTAGPPWPAF